MESGEDIKKQKGRGYVEGSVIVNDKLMWSLIWLNRNVATINVTLQYIYIYIYIKRFCFDVLSKSYLYVYSYISLFKKSQKKKN